MLNRFSTHATVRIDGPIPVLTAGRATTREVAAQQALLAARAQGGPDALVQLLTEMSRDEQLELLQILRRTTAPVQARWHEPTQDPSR